MAYENNGHVYDLKIIEPVGDEGPIGEKGRTGPDGANGRNEIMGTVPPAVVDFVENIYEDIYFFTEDIRANSGRKAGTINGDVWSFKPEDVVSWRMISGSPGKFSEPKLKSVVDGRAYFEAYWDGGIPSSSNADSYCLFEALVRRPIK